jgi:hypothetical protein
VRRLILVHAGYAPARALSKLRRITTLERTARWVFLGRNYLQQRTWSQELDGVLLQESVSGPLQSTVNCLKPAYLRLIADLGRKLQSDAWWASRISERNTLVSHLFLHCCYLFLAINLIDHSTEDFVVVSDSAAVLASLKKKYQQDDCFTVSYWGRWQEGVNYVKASVFSIAKILHLCVNGIRARWWGADGATPKKNVYLLHTYLEDSCFGENHKFNERYFPGLADWLKKQGKEVMILPVLSNVSKNYRDVWIWLRKSDASFVNIHRHSTFWDYINAICAAWKTATIRFPAIEMKEVNLRQLFLEERHNTAFDAINFYLYLSFPRRLRRIGINVHELIVEHENMIPEKMLALGFRRHMPETKIIGYQHSGLYPSLLCSQVIAEEAEVAPLPDKIICNGKYYLEILKSIGMPTELLREGPALRHGYLFDREQMPLNIEPVWDVLVLLPLMQDDAAELLHKIIAVKPDLGMQKIAVKLHPMMSAANLLDVCNLKSLPENYEFVDAGLGELLLQASVVVCMSSTVILEVAASGAKLIVLGRDAALNFNPLGFMRNAEIEVFNINDLVKKLQTVLVQDGGQSNASINVAEFFGQVDDVHLREFLI